jgi:hypothetical protein
MSKRTAAQKARTVAHHHKHVKPAHAHHKAATGHAHKHHKAAKHHKVAHKHKGTVARGLALGDAVACCAAEALAASLRLAGHAVSDKDVLALYWHTASDPDAGATVLATLEAAWRFGLGGVRPVFREVMPSDNPGLAQAPPEDGLRATRAGLILGVDLPGPHAVLADAGRWWSWGEPWCPCEFPDAVIEEAWAVSWL